MKIAYLYLVVFVGGAAVLALEILGTRILGPFYGVDIFLWSALIIVTLTALSLGYAVGGHWADKAPTVQRLCLSLTISGLWTIGIPWLKHPVLSLTEPLGLRGAVLVAAFILFFPPLVLLGMITPFVIKLRTVSLQEVGKITGNFFAVSTIASVFSAILTGFYLIPNFGVSHLTILVGVMLLVVAVLGFWLDKKSRSSIALGIVAGLAVVGSWIGTTERPDPASGLLEVVQSPYGELRVVQNENGRHLLIDGAIHTLADTSDWISYLHYAAVMDLPKNFFKTPGSALLIGLGGGSLVKQYARDSWSVDAVEIDPDVIRIARQYFDLKPGEGNVIQMDGRSFLASAGRVYDVILFDAYGSSSIPFHLATVEAFRLMAARLSPDGILAVNAEALGWDDPTIRVLAATLRREFREVLALPMEEPPDRFGNIVLLASNRALVPLREPEGNEYFDPDWRFGPGYQKVHAWDNRFTPDISHVDPLTDDLNPIDILTGKAHLIARQELHSYFKAGGTSW